MGFKDDIKKSSKNKNNIDDVRKKKSSMGTIPFYTELIFSIMGRGNIDKPDEGVMIPDGYFYYSTNKIFTKEGIKKVIFIQELPMYIEKEFLTRLKRDISEYGELRILKRFVPYKFDRNSLASKGRLQAWKGRAERYEQTKHKGSQSEEVFTDIEEQQADRVTQWMMSSWEWVNESERNKDIFCKYGIVLEILSERGHTIDDKLEKLYKMEEIITTTLKNLDVKYSGIFVQTNNYYKSFSPAGNEKGSMLAKLNQMGVITDRVATNLFDTGHGLVGDPTGLYLGTDVFTSTAVTYNLKKGSDAVNFLLSATTGGGKSGAAKTLMTHLAIEGIFSIDVDYEGDEYIELGEAHGARIINMSSESSSYFDTTEIGDLTGDTSIDLGLKEDAINTTKLVFDVLTDYKNGMDFEEVSLFNDMIKRVYGRRGVTEDPETWYLSRGSSYEELYRELLMMREEKEYQSKRTQVEKFVTKLRLYFDGNIYSNMFKKKLSINDLIGYPRIVFSYGMRGKTENTVDPRSLALRQLFVGYLIMLICNYNKTVLNKLTAVKMEELQRYLNHEASGKIVNDIITGGRKRNMIVFLITNNPLQIADTLDNTTGEMAKYAKAIKTNIQGFILGKLEDEVSERLCQSFSQLKNCLPELQLINEDPDFKFCFLVNYRGESSVVKFEIPPSLVNTPLYVTRTDQKD